MRRDEANALLLESPRGLLAGLAVHERNAIHRASKVESCGAGDVLQQANARSGRAVFPITAVLSIVQPLSDGRSIAVGMVGNDGLCGLDLVLEPTTLFAHAVVQSAGFVYSIAAEDLRHLFEGTQRLQKSVLRFAGTFVGQVATNAVCARFHAVAQRLARWLLMIDDRHGRLAVASATALLASALAARHDEIDATLAKLVSQGAIAHERDTVSIRREVLEASACECYDSVRIENGQPARLELRISEGTRKKPV